MVYKMWLPSMLAEVGVEGSIPSPVPIFLPVVKAFKPIARSLQAGWLRNCSTLCDLANALPDRWLVQTVPGIFPMRRFLSRCDELPTHDDLG